MAFEFRRFFLISTAALAIAAPAANAESGPPRAPAALQSTSDMALGWVKTFATGEAPNDASFEAPDYAGSDIETMLRGDLKTEMAKAGRAEQAGDGAVTFSIKVDQPPPKTKLPPKSPLQLESVPIDPTGRLTGSTVRPVISINPPKTDDKAPLMKVTIYAYRHGVRIWSGFAGAPLEQGVSRHALARALFSAAIAHFGEDAAIDAAVLKLDAPDPAQ